MHAVQRARHAGLVRPHGGASAQAPGVHAGAGAALSAQGWRDCRDALRRAGG